MTRTKRIQSRRFEVSKYPYAFHQVLRHFEQGRGVKELTFEFASEEKAHQIRFTWYNFVRALRSHNMIKDTATADSIIVKKRENMLIFGCRDDEPDFASMEEQMEKQVGVVDAGASILPTKSEMEKADEELKKWFKGTSTSTFGFEEQGEGMKGKTERDVMDELFGTPPAANGEGS